MSLTKSRDIQFIQGVIYQTRQRRQMKPRGSGRRTLASKVCRDLQIRFPRFQSLFCRMSLSQNRCTLLRDML